MLREISLNKPIPLTLAESAFQDHVQLTRLLNYYFSKKDTTIMQANRAMAEKDQATDLLINIGMDPAQASAFLIKNYKFDEFIATITTPFLTNENEDTLLGNGEHLVSLSFDPTSQQLHFSATILLINPADRDKTPHTTIRGTDMAEVYRKFHDAYGHYPWPAVCHATLVLDFTHMPDIQTQLSDCRFLIDETWLKSRETDPLEFLQRDFPTGRFTTQAMSYSAYVMKIQEKENPSSCIYDTIRAALPWGQVITHFLNEYKASTIALLVLILATLIILSSIYAFPSHPLTAFIINGKGHAAAYISTLICSILLLAAFVYKHWWQIKNTLQHFPRRNNNDPSNGDPPEPPGSPSINPNGGAAPRRNPNDARHDSPGPEPGRTTDVFPGQ